MALSSYKDLEVWKKSMQLAEKVYALTKRFLKEETYLFITQMRRASLSIPSNIAEGSGRGTRKDYAQFVAIAYGSCCELETQSMLATKLGMISKADFVELEPSIAGVGRMLKALQKALKVFSLET